MDHLSIGNTPDWASDSLSRLPPAGSSHSRSGQNGWATCWTGQLVRRPAIAQPFWAKRLGDVLDWPAGSSHSRRTAVAQPSHSRHTAMAWPSHSHRTAVLGKTAGRRAGLASWFVLVPAGSGRATGGVRLQIKEKLLTDGTTRNNQGKLFALACRERKALRVRIHPGKCSCGMEGSVVRRVIPSDNSCLFNAVGYVMEHNKHKAPELRQVIAATVASDPTKYNEAFLGKPNPEYVEWILDPEKWGEIKSLEMEFLQFFPVLRQEQGERSIASMPTPLLLSFICFQSTSLTPIYCSVSVLF
ncbi:hypothetical protein Taro_029577 [Colocasia esculenta]|uniref:Ubiquitin thioesterase OTU n=1 Tax=Colocasia esculenta TaxID=4460 RepID=A0A843VRJ8_COLES|nr:hypothetical protein [Colocasia esculenta]